MNAMWIFLRESTNCVPKLTDVVSLREEEISRELRPMPNPFGKVLFRPICPKTQYCELGPNDPSRNVVEIIFHKARTNPTKPRKRVESVLQVKNTTEVVEKFEKHRETIIKKANQQSKKHPRNSVDGNEMLLFYGTTMTCCYQKTKKVIDCCKIPTCRLCRTIQSKFDTEDTRKYGVKLSTNSDELSDSWKVSLTKTKNRRRAVIVCRTIAGKMINRDNEVFCEEWDSIGSGLNCNLKHLTVKNPYAVLPCFIVIFS